MRSEPILEAKNLCKRFGGLVAVNDVSFEVQKGEILGIIGPNGAGKTTLFNLISGFLGPDTGDILFKGQVITALPPHVIAKRGLTRSFQSIQMFSDMTVAETLLAAALLRLPMKEANDYTVDLMRKLGLYDKKDYLPGSLSLPDKKLVEMGKCFATRPDLVLFDEVMAGLTVAEAQILLAIIKDFRDSGMTFVIVEHVMPIIMNISDRIVVIDFGQKIAEGSPQEIVQNPEVQKSYLGEAMELA